MTFAWDKKRKEHKKRLAQILKTLTSKKTEKTLLVSATRLAVITDSEYKRVIAAFNRAAIKCQRNAYMQSLKSPQHTLSGKYAPTALALLEFVDAEQINLDRWIFAQAELIRQEYFTLFMCYGDNAHVRYEAWEDKQGRKFARSIDREGQTDSNLEGIRQSILSGHLAALSWIPQLQSLGTPDIGTALYFLMPQIQGWYAIAYEEFRRDVMEGGLCDAPHMMKWWMKYKRSKLIQETCRAALAEAEAAGGKLEWANHEG